MMTQERAELMGKIFKIGEEIKLRLGKDSPDSILIDQATMDINLRFISRETTQDEKITSLSKFFSEIENILLKK